MPTATPAPPHDTTQVRVVHRAEAVLIGNELLSGKVHDTNLVELARALRGLGIQLTRAAMVLDDVDVIAAEIAAARARCDVVFTSGGIGPTHDDVTLAAAARAFDLELTISAPLIELLRDHYGPGCHDENLRMARVPTGAWLACAPASPWPVVVVRDVWLLPGVPEVFRLKLEVVRRWLRGPGPIHTRSVFCATPEPALVALLDAVVAAHPEVEIGSYPRWDPTDHQTRITLDGRDEARVEAACIDLLARLPAGEPVRQE